MSDNRLKKEFTKKDVTRLRNLYSGKYGDSTMNQVGYTKKEVEHAEGDVWEENDKKWTIKGGIKQTYTQLDGVKKLVAVPMLCPECNRRMKDRLDKQMYQMQGKCFSCVQAFETQLKIEGKYDAYARDIMYKNAGTFVEEAREYIEEIATQSSGIYTETGVREDWTGPDVNEKVIQKMKEELAELEDKITNNK